ncbi:hypothetical protein HPB48_000028 [Haemaphysalis longicornis]|uniref:Uncharacterized protein n=1 Tax=Haemaphysalis longicornis TaxID=44386 RepID=A0A9J6FXG1_HAELO|nr:hypothetical protein HPB48_000028 [Haemaphysalis longicornis]
MCSWSGCDEFGVRTEMMSGAARPGAGPHQTDAARKAPSRQRTPTWLFVPGGCTPIVQPADVSWMKTIQGQPSGGPGQASFELGQGTPKGNLKKPSRQDVVNFVSKARAAVSEEVVARSFKRCEDGELHERLASAIPPSAALPTTSNSVREEVVDLFF